MPSTLNARLLTGRLRATPWLAAAALGLLLNGCGSSDTNEAPSVTLATTPTSA